MTRIFCQITHHPERVTVVWSDGTASFSPYHLVGQELEQMHRDAGQARTHLAKLLSQEVPEEKEILALAQAGHRLFHDLFQLGQANSQVSQEVLTWLRGLQGKNEIESIEFLSDAPGLYPWQLLLDGEPTANALRDRHFWGQRFSMAVGHRANPLRHAPANESPSVVLIADPAALDQNWSQWANDHLAARVTGLDQARSLYEDEGADLVVVLGAIQDQGMLIGNETLSTDQLATWISNSEGNPYPLVVLLPMGNFSGSQFPEFHRAAVNGFPGLVTVDFPVAGAAVGEFLREALTSWLGDRKPIGNVLRQARERQGLIGLAVNAYCPAGFRLPTPGEEIAEFSLPPLELPDQPYRPLRAFDRDDQALFLGRELDSFRVASLLDQAEARGVILHGVGGCGKTSLLQAGVFPFLEEEAVGYRVLRNRLPDEDQTGEDDLSILAIRPGGDLLGQLAQGLAVFSSQPYQYVTPTGRTVTVDLPGLILSKAGAGNQADAIQAAAPAAVAAAGTSIAAPGMEPQADVPESPAAFLYQELTTGSANALAELVDRVTRELPYSLVLWIEQGEELLTLKEANLDHGLRLLENLLNSTANCKVILTIRTDYLGQVRDLMTRATAHWREYYLPELTSGQMEEVLLAPTAAGPLYRCPTIPLNHYGFVFETGLVPGLIQQAEAMGMRGGWAMANLQALCADVVARIKKRGESTIRLGDIKDARLRPEDQLTPQGSDGKQNASPGMPELKATLGALSRHIESRLSEMSLPIKDRTRLRDLIFGLHQMNSAGSPVRNLVKDAEAVQAWGGLPSVEQAVRAAENASLLEVNQLLVGGREGLYIGLPQDSLARAGAEFGAIKRAKTYSRVKIIDLLWIALPLLLLACVLTWVLTRRTVTATPGEEEITNKMVPVFQKQIHRIIEQARPPFYNATMSQAQKALEAGDALRARQLLLGLQPANPQIPDLRAFDWHLLWRQVNGERKNLVGHPAPLTATAITANNKVLASASGDGMIKLWSVDTGLEIAVLKLPQEGKDSILALAFSPDSKVLASGGADKTIRLWEVPAVEQESLVIAKERKTLTYHTAAVTSLVFQDATRLASAGEDGMVVLWNVEKGKEETVLKDHGKAVAAVALSADGKWLASGGVEGKVIVRDAGGQKVVQTLEVGGAIHALAFAPDNKVLAVGSSESMVGIHQGTATTWEVASGKKLAGSMIHGQAVLAVAFAPDGKSLATAGKDLLVRFWNPNTGQPGQSLPGHYGWVSTLAWSRDGNTLITGSFDQTVKVWDVATMHNPTIIETGPQPVLCVGISGTGGLLASGHRGGVVKIWNSGSNQLIKELSGHLGDVTAVAFTSGESVPKLAVATASAQGEGEIKIYELNNLKDFQSKLLFTLKQAKGVRCLAFNHSGDMLASGGDDLTAILWKVNSGNIHKTLTGHKEPVRCLGFSHSGNLLATGSGRTVRVWNVQDGKMVRDPLEAQAGDVAALTLDEIDNLITAGADHTVNLWRWNREGEPGLLLSNRPHTRPITAMHPVAAANVLFFVTASEDGTVVLSDLVQGDRLRLMGHAGPVRALALSPTGKLLVSAGQDGALRLYRASPPSPLVQGK